MVSEDPPVFVSCPKLMAQGLSRRDVFSKDISKARWSYTGRGPGTDPEVSPELDFATHDQQQEDPRRTWVFSELLDCPVVLRPRDLYQTGIPMGTGAQLGFASPVCLTSLPHRFMPRSCGPP